VPNGKTDFKPDNLKEAVGQNVWDVCIHSAITVKH